MMSNGILLAGLVCLVAGATIKVWAFAIFAAFTVFAVSIVSLVNGGTVTDTVLLVVALLVVMEVCYIAGIVALNIFRRVARQRLPQHDQSKPATLQKPANLAKVVQIRRDRQQG